MKITKMYKIVDNGITKITGQVPEGAEVLETLNILNAEEGYDLVRKANNENMGVNFWLKDDDKKANYKEVEQEEPVNK